MSYAIVEAPSILGLMPLQALTLTLLGVSPAQSERERPTSAVVLDRLTGRVRPRQENIIYRHDLDIGNATGWHGVTAAAMEDCGAGRATFATPYKVVHGASDVAVGQRGCS